MDASFFVAIGFILFVLLLAYLGVHKQIAGALDGRSKLIADELAQAQKLREEAAAVLASFEKKKLEAEEEAKAIVAQARTEAELLAKETRERLTDFVARRTKQAEQKIAMAEAQATSDVRAAAADAAVKAAETVLKGETAGAAGATLVDKGIADIKSLLN